MSRTPTPQRITMALDLRSLYGPEVDLACGTYEGNPAGDVDRWEDPADPALPDERQVELLAALTRFPVAFFYEPPPPSLGRVFICDRSRRRHGLTVIEADGAVSLDPPPLRRRTTKEDDVARKPAHPRARPVAPGQRPTRTARHDFLPDSDVPRDHRGRQYCQTCSCHGTPGDAKHWSDDQIDQRQLDQRQLDQRRLGERND